LSAVRIDVEARLLEHVFLQRYRPRQRRHQAPILAHGDFRGAGGRYGQDHHGDRERGVEPHDVFPHLRLR